MYKDFVDVLWVNAHSMRGKRSISEVCRFMVYVLFIRYIDMEKDREKNSEMALQSYDIRYSVDYLALTYGEIVNSEMLAEYVKKIEEELLHGDGMIADGFRGLLDRMEACHVRAVFRMIGSVNFKNREQLYDVASLLLDRLPYVHGNLKDKTFANLSLCRLEGRLLDCQEGMTVYDGFCGHGLSVSEAAGGNGIVYMQDTDRGAAAIATVMALLKGNRIGSVRCGDSLVNPMSNEKYDRIVCEPPLVPKYENSYRSAIPEDSILYPKILDDKSLALRHVMAHLNDDGMAVVLVPLTIFLSQSSSSIREELSGMSLDAVITLPAGAVPNVRKETALLVFNKGRESDTLCMIDGKKYVFKMDKNHYVINDEAISRIVDIYQNRETVDGKSCFIEKKEIESLNVSEIFSPDMGDSVMSGDVVSCQKRYRQLAEELAELDGQLEAVRGRFIEDVDALTIVMPIV